MAGKQKKTALLSLLLGSTLLVCSLSLFVFRSAEKRRGDDMDECWMRARYIGRLLVHYANVNGRLPRVRKGDSKRPPSWVGSLYDMQRDEGASANELTRALKCPFDNSDLATSYELNSTVAGRSLSTMPSDMWDNVPLIIERSGIHKHGTIVYLSGRIDFPR